MAATYSKHESTGLNGEFTSFRIFHDRSSQTSSRRCFTTGVDCAGMQRADISIDCKQLDNIKQ